MKGFCYTVSLARPFRRRLRSTLRPPAVFIRARKPCTFFIFRFLRFRSVPDFAFIIKNN